MKIRKIKLKDYTKDFVTIKINNNDFKFVGTDQIREYIKANNLITPKIFGVDEELAINEDYFCKIIEELKEEVEWNGYEDINTMVDYNDKNIKNMNKYFKKWIKGNSNALTTLNIDYYTEIIEY